MARVFTWSVCGMNGTPYPGICSEEPGPAGGRLVKQKHTLTAEDELILEQTTPDERIPTLARRYPFVEKSDDGA